MNSFKLPLALPGMNFREVGLQNELAVLRTIGDQGWVRELELAILTGFGLEKTELISRRLAKKGLVFREKIGNSGIFLRLRKEGADQVNCRSGKDVEIPKSWRHDSVAIQALNFLSCTLLDSPRKILSEAKLRKSEVAKGKIPDGALEGEAIFFEQEWAKKSGHLLQTQAHNIVRLAKVGIQSIISYPFPPQICGGINHELRNAHAIRDLLQGKDVLILFLRCHFNDVRGFQCAKPSRFELIELPLSVNSRAEGQRLGQFSKIGWCDYLPDEEGSIFSEMFFEGGQIYEVKFCDGGGLIQHECHIDGIVNYGPIEMAFSKFMEREKLRIRYQFLKFELKSDSRSNLDIHGGESGSEELF